MRFLILILIAPACGLAATGSDISEAGTADTLAPLIELISPAGGYFPPGDVEFVWTIAEDSLLLASDAVVLRVHMDDTEVLSISMPMQSSANYSYVWTPPTETAGEATWEIEGRDFFGNASLSISEPFVITALPSDSALPSALTLMKAWPNPFNPSTRIRFGLPCESDVELRVYDLSGNRVAELFQGQLKAGWHEMLWNADGVSSGVYFAKLNAGFQTRSTKLVLIK